MQQRGNDWALLLLCVGLFFDQDLIAAEAWRAALGRASGDKVLDDPKLLRRSLKREEQDKARKGKRWEERVTAQQEQQQARQDK